MNGSGELMSPEKPHDAARGWAWTERAACRGEEWELFFGPDEDGGRESVDAREAREAAALGVCARCPVRGECLEFAESTQQRYGIWGGRTEDELRFKRRLRRARVEAERPSDVFVSSLGSRRRLRAAACAGHGVVEAAEMTGLSTTAVSDIRAGRRPRIQRWVAEAISRAYPEMATTVATHKSATQIRRAASAAGWHPAAAWAGLDIDDPKVVPHSVAA